VNGQSVTILTDSKGLTLYYNKNDSATSITCTGGCASAWPPLSGSGTPTSSATLPGTLTVFQGQIEYQGHPLYTYVGDTQAGQTTGEGVGGIWFVATTTLASASNGSSTSKGY
jgi:predicted lipoprotein with Yx(FWY)xxD motif